MSDTTPKITFYDIASAAPLRTFAPNPWKTRLALNHKKVSYSTKWVQMPDIQAVREELGVPANRTLPDGSPYHTLPVIKDESSNNLVGDTFEIALYLDQAYPDQPLLFRPLTIGLTAGWNQHIDTLFTKYTIFCVDMPFDPKVQDQVAAMFAKRAEAMEIPPTPSETDHEKKWREFESAMGELAKAYKHTGGTTDHFWRLTGTASDQAQRAPAGREQPSVWLDGDEPVYADFILGAWLKMYEASLPRKDWERMRTWHGGFWGRIVDALAPWAETK
jgi:glutathione S-transferase